MLENSAKGDLSAKMRVFLPLLCVLCAAPVQSIFEGTCLRKDPPPGALVLPVGSSVVLTCSGHVTVNGVKVRNSSNSNRRGRSSSATPTTVTIINNTLSVKSDRHATESAVSERHLSNPAVTGGNRSLSYTQTGYTASPAAYTSKPSTGRRLLMAEDMDDESDYEEEEEEGEEGSRVTRGIKSRPQWKWNGRTVGKEKRDWGEIMFERRGATLSLSSVRLTDSGKYACNYRGRERFSIKLIIADPPEKPSLFCYKRSPSSKIRCEWTPQKPVKNQKPSCYLLLSKNLTQPFLPVKCSYSSRASRCWCAMEHNDEELRVTHRVYLCVTSIGGNATSQLLNFAPLWILKPDPPANVTIQEEVGDERKIRVSWSRPISWKTEDNHYQLDYEIKYRPVMSSHFQQEKTLRGKRNYLITDALPGVEYLIQLRAKDEFDGLWSEWGAPVFGQSWTAPRSYDVTPTATDIESSGSEGSGTDAPPTLTPVSTKPLEVSPHFLWIPFAILLVILAAYIFRHRDRFVSKLRSLSVITKCGYSPESQPSVPTPPEGQALVTFGPPRYKEPLQSKEEEEGEQENEEEQSVNERTETMHFNNTSYFFLQQS